MKRYLRRFFDVSAGTRIGTLLLLVAMGVILSITVARLLADGTSSTTSTNCGPGTGSPGIDCFNNNTGVACDPATYTPPAATVTENIPAHQSSFAWTSKTVAAGTSLADPVTASQPNGTRTTVSKYCDSTTNTVWDQTTNETLTFAVTVSWDTQDGTWPGSFSETTTLTASAEITNSGTTTTPSGYPKTVSLGSVTVDVPSTYTISLDSPDTFYPVGDDYDLSALVTDENAHAVEGVTVTFSGPFTSATETTDSTGFATVTVNSQTPENDASIEASCDQPDNSGEATDSATSDIIAVDAITSDVDLYGPGETVDLTITCTATNGWPTGEAPSLEAKDWFGNTLGGTFGAAQTNAGGEIAITWTPPTGFLSTTIDDVEITATYGSGVNSEKTCYITCWGPKLALTNHFNDPDADGGVYKIDTGTAEFEVTIEPPEIVITPDSYTYSFGDGSADVTTSLQQGATCQHVFPYIDIFSATVTVLTDGIEYTSTASVSLDYSNVYPRSYYSTSTYDFPGLADWIHQRDALLIPLTGVNLTEHDLLVNSNPFNFGDPKWLYVTYNPDSMAPFDIPLDIADDQIIDNPADGGSGSPPQPPEDLTLPIFEDYVLTALPHLDPTPEMTLLDENPNPGQLMDKLKELKDYLEESSIGAGKIKDAVTKVDQFGQKVNALVIAADDTKAKFQTAKTTFSIPDFAIYAQSVSVLVLKLKDAYDASLEVLTILEEIKGATQLSIESIEFLETFSKEMKDLLDEINAAFAILDAYKASQQALKESSAF